MASAADIAASLAEAIGGNDPEVTVDTFLPSGFPPLDHASNSTWDQGAFPVGRMIEIAGPPSSGKTALATAAMSGAQAMGGIAGFMDHERSFSLKLAPKLGLEVTPGRFIFKTPKTFEESLQICVVAANHIRKNKLIKKDAPICWVFDSLAAMVPQSAYYEMKNGKAVGVKSLEDRNMNDNTALARATSNAFPAFAQHCEELGICAIFLNQMRTDLNVKFGDPRKTTGGNAPEFYFSQRLWLSASQIKKGTDIIGMEVTGKYKKNKIARPFQEATWRFEFQEDGTGKFNRYRSLIDFLEGLGVIVKGKQAGTVVWDGKNVAKATLSDKLEADGPAGFAKLTALLPANYEPPVVAEVEGDFDEDAATPIAA